MKETPILQVNELTKRYGATTALEGVSVAFRRGEVHALVGENGAGKSTLMNQLYGMYTPTSGEILIGGEPTVIDSPKTAIAKGIGMVHQHFMLVQPFTITENIVLGMEPRNGIKLDMKKARESVLEISKRYQLRSIRTRRSRTFPSECSSAWKS